MSNMSRRRQISAHRRLIRPGGGKSGLPRSNPAWARGIPAWPGRNSAQITARGRQSRPGRILLIWPSRGRWWQPTRALAAGPAGAPARWPSRSAGLQAQPGHWPGGPVGADNLEEWSGSPAQSGTLVTGPARGEGLRPSRGRW
jgi:hypothetical protein